jgi:hypothetical protein
MYLSGFVAPKLQFCRFIVSCIYLFLHDLHVVRVRIRGYLSTLGLNAVTLGLLLTLPTLQSEQ